MRRPLTVDGRKVVPALFNFSQRMAELHIGKMIRERVEQRGISVEWLARQLCCERTNVYSIYRRRSVDTDLLLRLSRILEYDFLSEIARRELSVRDGRQ